LRKLKHIFSESFEIVEIVISCFFMIKIGLKKLTSFIQKEFLSKLFLIKMKNNIQLF